MNKPGPTAQQRILQPEGWPRPKGYVNGIAAKGTPIFLSGQIGWDASGVFASGFVGQVRQALENIVSLLAEAGATPENVVRLTWFVTDLDAYSGNLKDVGKAYRESFGAFYPTMTMVQVTRLVEPQAMVEIEATAVIPD
jgi:enamine deaminase RidA (YjgF/YER057c/UK114 family)